MRTRCAGSCRRDGPEGRSGRLDPGSSVSDIDSPAEAHALRAQAALERRDWAEAAQQARRSLSHARDNPSAWYALGRAYKELGDLEAAIACYRRALLGAPGNSELLTSLGTAYALKGAADEARRTYEQVLAREPGHAGAAASLAALSAAPAGGPRGLAQLRAEAQALRAAGRPAEALARCREALRLAPRSAPLLFATGLLLDELGDQPESLARFEAAVRADPAYVPAIEMARRICIGAGLLDKARRYTQMLLARGDDDDLRLALALCVRAIQPSAGELERSRVEYRRGLDEALARGWRGSQLNAAHIVGAFFLAYQGDCNAALQRKAAQLFAAAFPNLGFTAAHCAADRGRRPGRIRVGFISAFLNNHSIGKTSAGLIAGLDRERFEVYALHLPPARRDAVELAIRASADRAIDVDADLGRAQRQIAALELDVLFYQDIGMESMSYRLACSRLASVQCVSYGHPDTTGIPNMDYFVSNDLYEGEGAAGHYTERLFQLRALPTLAYYSRPQAPAAVPERGVFGLHGDDHVYLCPQTLFKLHPDFDSLLAGILRRDPQGIIVLIRGQYEDHTQALRERLWRSLGALAQRILILDRMPFARYMQLLSIGDVCLDTIHFNGMNSSLEALSAGLPIVTLPGALQRARHTQAMYRTLGVTDCIAHSAGSYVDIAVRLACDADFARSVRSRIRERAGLLYEDARVLREFERFFISALREQRPDIVWPEARRAGDSRAA